MSSAQANKDALARAQYMIRQINAELNQMKASNVQIKLEKQEVDKEYKKLKKKYNKLTKNSDSKSKKLSSKIDNIKQRYIQERDAHLETKKILNEVTKDKNSLSDLSGRKTDKINLCVASNKKLYSINKQILLRYEDKGVWDSLTQAEPFSRLSQVEIENLVDDYQYQIEDLKIDSNL